MELFKHISLTARQWRGILKWTLYALLFLILLTVQTVILPRVPIFGIKLRIMPILLVCIAIREGAEKGGLFVLLCSLVYALSGTEYGNLSLLCVTACAVVSAVLCRDVLASRFWPIALCCFASLLLSESVIFLFKLVLGVGGVQHFFRVLLPGVALSMLAYPLIYLLVKGVSRTGGTHAI